MSRARSLCGAPPAASAGGDCTTVAQEVWFGNDSNREYAGFKSAQEISARISLLEVVISMAIMTIGLVSLLGVFGIAMAATQDSQQDMIAKQLANEASKHRHRSQHVSEAMERHSERCRRRGLPFRLSTGLQGRNGRHHGNGR